MMRDSLEDRIRRHYGPDSIARRPSRRPARPGPRGSAAACPLADHRILRLRRSGALSSLAGRDGLVDLAEDLTVIRPNDARPDRPRRVFGGGGS
ncbi:hypothetical protein [Methylobacterium sp. UNC300MFChir4.1]|uniref:hypothetical protein n=2 Tax=unclassified Methylobacterium TaxID=2615210 RepID=UPI000C20FE66|nr:hypothetical protein [Methylobacterium sp. UNC300MFChir4.1]